MEEQGTRCPHCQLVFRVAAAHLNAAGGMVRCGMCLTTFDALVNQVGVEQQEPSATPIWAEIADDDPVIDDRFDLARLEDEEFDVGDSAVTGEGIPPELDDIVAADLDLSVLEAGEGALSGGADLDTPIGASDHALDNANVEVLSDLESLLLSAERDAGVEPELGFDILPPEPEPEFEIPEPSSTGHEALPSVDKLPAEDEATSVHGDGDYPELGYPGLGYPGLGHPGLGDEDTSYQDGDATQKAIEELEKTVFGEDVPGADLHRQARRSLEGKLGENLDENVNESLNQNFNLDLGIERNLNIAEIDATKASSASLTADASRPNDFPDVPPNLAPPNFALSGPSLTDIPSTHTFGEFGAIRPAKGLGAGLGSRLGSGLGAVMILLLGGGILAAQYLFFKADRFGSQGEYAPLLDPLCSVLPCRGYEFSDLTAIQTKNLVVRTHPRHGGALQVDATLVNLAHRPQRFPQLILTFEDLQGAVLARRSFKPEEYLKGELDGTSTMPSGQPIHFILDIIDPGELAVSYTLIPAH